METMYIENKKSLYHIIFEKYHSKTLNHFTRFSITTRKTEEDAWSYMSFLSEQTGIKIKPLY